MSATDELRRMLDERGVEWTEGIARPELTQVRIDGKVVKFHPWQPNTLKVSLFDITPEQAIAATLGPAYEPPVAAHWDGDTLTLTIPRDPSCIRVQRSAEQPCKVYADESKVIAATLGNDGVGRTNDGLADLQAENAKLREFASKSFSMAFNFYHGAGTAEDLRELKVEYHELGIEVTA